MRYERSMLVLAFAMLAGSAASHAQSEPDCRLPESDIRKLWAMASGRTEEERTKTAETLIRAQCDLQNRSLRPAAPLPPDLQKYRH
jgi:hypothetical protein